MLLEYSFPIPQPLRSRNFNGMWYFWSKCKIIACVPGIRDVPLRSRESAGHFLKMYDVIGDRIDEDGNGDDDDDVIDDDVMEDAADDEDGDDVIAVLRRRVRTGIGMD